MVARKATSVCLPRQPSEPIHYARNCSLNSGHDYGTDLSADQKRDLIEYLKTL